MVLMGLHGIHVVYGHLAKGRLIKDGWSKDDWSSGRFINGRFVKHHSNEETNVIHCETY